MLGPIVYAQGALACCTTKSRPAILNVAERAAPPFDWTVMVVVPVPVRLGGFADTHAGLPVTVHPQPAVVVTVTEMVPPLDEGLWLPGLIVYAHAGWLC